MAKMETSWFSKIKDKKYFESISNPHFLELDGLIILESHYTPESFEQWKKMLEGRNSPADAQKMGNTINHVHLDDLVYEESLQIELGEYLQKIWIDALSVQFPNYEFECKVKQSERGWELVMWRRR